MLMVTINWKPSKKEVRDFGLIAFVLLTAISILLYLIKDLTFVSSLYISGAGLAIFILSLISSTAVKIIYIVGQIMTFPIGMAVSFIVLALFYYLIITPIGILFQIFGRDSLDIRFDPKASTYWVRHNQTKSVERYFRQF